MNGEKMKIKVNLKTTWMLTLNYTADKALAGSKNHNYVDLIPGNNEFEMSEKEFADVENHLERHKSAGNLDYTVEKPKKKREPKPEKTETEDK